MPFLPREHLTTYVKARPLEQLHSDREVTLALQRRGYEWIQDEHNLILGKNLPEIGNGVLLVMKSLKVPKDALSVWSIRLDEDVDQDTTPDVQPNEASVKEELHDMFDFHQAQFSVGLISYRSVQEE